MDIEKFEQHIYTEYHTIAIRGSIHVVFLVEWSMKKLQNKLKNIKMIIEFLCIHKISYTKKDNYVKAW